MDSNAIKKSENEHMCVCARVLLYIEGSRFGVKRDDSSVKLPFAGLIRMAGDRGCLPHSSWSSFSG